MLTYHFRLQFENVALDDFDVLDALATIPDVLWSEDVVGVFATATIKAASGIQAVRQAVTTVCAIVPSAKPVRLDRDLVSITDVADRIGVNRETVRVWTSGAAKRKGEFPRPRGCVSGNIKVWGWSEVSEWLEANLAIKSEFATLRHQDETVANAQLTEWCAELGDHGTRLPTAWLFSSRTADEIDRTQRRRPTLNPTQTSDWQIIDG